MALEFTKFSGARNILEFCGAISTRKAVGF
jgi:hypothetical protein